MCNLKQKQTILQNKNGYAYDAKCKWEFFVFPAVLFLFVFS